MQKNSENILGFIKLETGDKGISPLNDVFLSYTFQQEAYWETLRRMTNIFYEDYIANCSETKIKPIEGEIVVKTQFPHFRNFSTSTPKEQDVQIESSVQIDYIEFQNDVYPRIPIEMRSVEYFGFSLTRGKDKQATNMWLLNGSVSKLLDGNIYSNYILMDEVNHRPHPSSSNLLYVDLKRLAQTRSQAGELAGVLVGKIAEPIDSDVKLIFKNLKHSFNTFKADTEVKNIMTKAEILVERGEARGEAKAQVIIDKQNERIKELEALLVKNTE